VLNGVYGPELYGHVATATVATGADEAEKGSADENGSDSADDDDASLESVD